MGPFGPIGHQPMLIISGGPATAAYRACPAPADRECLTGFVVPYNLNSAPDASGVSIRLLPGAFGPSALEGVSALVNHDESRRVAFVGDGTLTLIDGPDGLRFELSVHSPRAQAERLLQAGRVGLINGVSPKFEMHSWWYSPDRKTQIVERADLIEISLLVGLETPRWRDTWAIVAPRRH